MIAEKINSALGALKTIKTNLNTTDYFIMRLAINELKDASNMARQMEATFIVPVIEYGPNFYDVPVSIAERNTNGQEN